MGLISNEGERRVGVNWCGHTPPQDLESKELNFVLNKYIAVEMKAVGEEVALYIMLLVRVSNSWNDV